MAASAITFKSVGKTTAQIQDEIAAASPTVPIGIKTPLRKGSFSLFEMNTDLFDQIRDNLRNLIMTNWGERVALFYFGANLSELSTERTSREDYDQEVASRIKSAVDVWMPYVALDELVPLDDPSDALGRSRTLTVPLRRYLVTYSVPSLDSPKQSLEIVVGIA